MKPTIHCLVISLLISSSCFSQEEQTDSSKTLGEVFVKAYEQNRKLIDVAAPVSITGQSQLKRFGNTSILPAVNITPGVRMEERSPFGVRDVKIYLNEIPLTDPSGNTYLNQLSYYNFNSIEIIKGPASSLYGSGTGGTLLIESMNQNEQAGATVEYTAGSYNLHNIYAALSTGSEKLVSRGTFQHQQNNGYRNQSELRRDVHSWTG